MVTKIVKRTIVSIILISSHINSQAPKSVLVDDDYDATTPGWDVTHFAEIQKGINSVAEAGTVYVAAGTWNESLHIRKGKSLIGTGAGQSFINGDGSANTISIEDSGSIIKNFTLNNSGGNWNNFAINLYLAYNVEVKKNHILDKGIGLSSSHNNKISENLIVGQGSIFIANESWSNLIKNNELRYVLYPGQIWVLDNCRNNIISDNKIIGDSIDASCTGIRSMQSSNNLYENNKTQGFRVHIIMGAGDSNIIAGNTITGHRLYPEEIGGGIVIFRGDNNTIINNKIDNVIDGGITLFGASSNNILQSNSITNTERGIGLYYQSNSNSIINNTVDKNSVGIVLDNTSENRVYNNNITNNQICGYDDGNNKWSFKGRGNYWSDYQGEDQDRDGVGDSPQLIHSTVKDSFPVPQIIPITPASVPKLHLATFKATTDKIVEITDEQMRANEKIKIAESFVVRGGGSLILDQVEWEVANNYYGELITVDSGGALKITKSKIISQSGSILVDMGANLHIENSELIGLGLWGGGIEIGCNNAVIKNNVIRKAYYAISIRDESSENQIINNRLSEAMCGIRICCNTSTGNRIEGNEIYNVVASAINGNGLFKSKIVNNSFSYIWDETIFLVGCGRDCGSGQNQINKNNFFQCGLSDTDWDNIWHQNTEGNYYSDYLDRYPNGQKHYSFSGIWDKPYGYKKNKDNYPLMYPVYLDTTMPIPQQPLLLSPSPGAISIPIDRELMWNSSSTAITYRLQISEHSNFEKPIFNQGGITDTVKAVNELKESTLYYWRVLSENSGVISDWSEVHQFATVTSTDAREPNDIELQHSFKLYQNHFQPSNPFITIHLTIPKICTVKLKIYDMLGREVDIILDKRMKSGEYTFLWNPKHLESGIYLCKLQSRNISETVKFIL